MTLPKHLRPRWRYFAIGLRSWPDVSFSREELETAVRRSARELYGDVGAAEMSLQVMRFRWGDGAGEAIVRTRREHVRRARAAIACTPSVGNAPLGVHVRGQSGTVRACEENYLGSGAESLTENTVVFEGAERPALARGMEVDVRVADAFVGATRLDLE